MTISRASVVSLVDERTGVRFPIVEIFGPTLQGEGPDAGRPAYFIRFGGCDFRCSWCDSMYAVEPAQVRGDARHLDSGEIVTELATLEAGPDLVVLSGGNPALLELAPLIDALHSTGCQVAVETQGSRWKAWLADVDLVVVSPKGPSSEMDTPPHRDSLHRFLTSARDAGAPVVLKPVVFDAADLGFARCLASRYPDLPLYLSTGTDVGKSDAATIEGLRGRLRWLSEHVARDAAFRRAHVGIQQHVLAWGTRRGV
jgi:7-carboxy-7-deazaguanine synthase